MESTHSTVPGKGIIHQYVTRTGDAFSLVINENGTRDLIVYESSDSDTPQHTLVLEPDEADQLAESLHTRPLVDRVTAIERRLNQLTGSSA